ncbi:6894_t:CDS:2, partial [Dentiscutata erythropus]
MANLDPIIQIDRGLNRIENHLRNVGTPLNNPINIINGIRGSLNAVRHNYQSAYQDIDDVIAQRDDRDNQITWLQQDINRYRQLDTLQQNHINQLTQDGITLQNRVRDIERSHVDCLPILYNHLPENLELRVRMTAPATKDAFFTNLRNCWLESNGSRSNIQSPNIASQTHMTIPTPPPQIQYYQHPQPQSQPQQQSQENEKKSTEYLESIAMRLGYSDSASRNPDALENFIEDELYSRLGHANYHLRREPFGQVREVNTRVITRASTSGAKKVYTTKKPQKPTKVTYKCSNCGKKLENSDQEDEPIEIPVKKKSSIKKKSIVTLEQEVFLESLKHMISELIPHCPKEILIEVRTFLNSLFIKMKDQFDLHYGEKYTVKERNKGSDSSDLISPSEKLSHNKDTEYHSLNHAIK